MAVLIALLAALNVGHWARSSSREAVPTIRSIAVLRLKTSWGLSTRLCGRLDHDALTTELARARLLEVTSRTSATQYKGGRQSLRTIAKNLNVDAIVEGTVSRSGQHMEINVQLIQVSSDRHLWAQRYDRDVRTLAALPSEIAWDILRAVPADMGARESHRLANARPANADAYEAYIKGRFFWSKREPESLSKALKYFEQAISADLVCAGLFGLSDTYRMCRMCSLPRETPCQKQKRQRASSGIGRHAG